VRTVTLIRADTHVVMKSQVFIPFAFFGVALVVAFIVG
jgi:hypothetical protein